MSQILRPDQDGSVLTVWVNESGSATGWASIDDVSADDATTHIDGETASDTAQQATYNFPDPDQGAPEDRSGDSHILTYRWRMVAPAGGKPENDNGEFGVLLREVTTTRASVTHSGVNSTNSGSWTTSTLALTAGEAAAISNYNDLRVRFTIRSVGAADSARAQVTQVFLRIPHTPIIPPLLGSTGVIYAPRVQLNLTAPLLPSTEQIFVPVLEYVQYIDPPLIASTEQIFLPDLIHEQYLDPPLIGSSEVIYAPAEIEPVVVLRPPLIGSSEVIYAPAEIEPVVVLRPPLIGSSEQFFQALITGGTSQFLGIVDDVRFYNKGLTASEVGRSAMRELESDEWSASRCVDYWQFSEGTGTVTYGSQSEAANGELRGTAQWVGFEGVADLAGQRKPVVYGIRRMRAPVWVDTQRLVCQANDGVTEQIIPLENGFAGLTYDGDTPNLYDWSPVAGHYVTQLDRGLIRFGSTPLGGPGGAEGFLAFDVKGDATEEWSGEGGEIMRRLLVRAGVDPDAEIDAISLTQLLTARPGNIGYSTGNGKETLQTVLDKIAETLDCWYSFGDTGIVQFGVRGIAASGLVPGPKFDEMGLRESAVEVLADYEIGDHDIDEGGPKWPTTAPVTRACTFLYRHHEVKVPLEKVSGSVPAAERSKFAKDWRAAPAPLLGRDFDEEFADAVDVELQSLWDERQHALRAAERRLAVDRFPRHLLEVSLRHQLYRRKYYLGQRFAWGSEMLGIAPRLYLTAAITRDPEGRRVTIQGWAATPETEDAAKDAAAKAEDAARTA